jgi:hypothetical protein
MGDINVDGYSGGVDEDGSRGNSSSRQGARTETSVSRNWSSTVAALRNFSWMETELFRVFVSERFYRRKGDVKGWPGGPHHTLAQPEGGGGGAPLGGVAATWPSPSLLWTMSSCRKKIGGLAFVSSNSENISCITFLKYKNNRKQKLALWHLVNRLVP